MTVAISYFGIFARLSHHIYCSRRSSFGIQHTSYYILHTIEFVCSFLFFSLFFFFILELIMCRWPFLFSLFFRSLFVAKGRSSNFRNEHRMSWINSQFTLYYNNVSSNSLFFLSSAIHFYFQFASSLFSSIYLHFIIGLKMETRMNRKLSTHTYTYTPESLLYGPDAEDNAFTSR